MVAIKVIKDQASAVHDAAEADADLQRMWQQRGHELKTAKHDLAESILAWGAEHDVPLNTWELVAKLASVKLQTGERH